MKQLNTQSLIYMISFTENLEKPKSKIFSLSLSFLSFLSFPLSPSLSLPVTLFFLSFYFPLATATLPPFLHLPERLTHFFISPFFFSLSLAPAPPFLSLLSCSFSPTPKPKAPCYLGSAFRLDFSLLAVAASSTPPLGRR
jgi:hypothetical protein